MENVPFKTADVMTLRLQITLPIYSGQNILSLTRHIVLLYTHEVHVQATKALKRFLCMYPQMSESSSYPGRAATPLQLLIHKEIG